jgi:hypothetical protein
MRICVSSNGSVFVTGETRKDSTSLSDLFVLKYSASGQQDVSVDRYAGYFALLGPDRSLKLAYCWSHQRRDFVNVIQSADQGSGWAEQRVELINQLFGTNAPRRRAWFQGSSAAFGPLDQSVRQQVAQLKERMEGELAGGQQRPEQEMILKSLRTTEGPLRWYP